MKKKASFQDIFFLAIIGLMAAMMFVVGYMMTSKVNDNFQADDKIGTVGKAIIQDTTTNMVTWLDGIFLVVLIAGWLGAIILAFQIPSHPIFFFISIVIYVVMVLIAAVLGNTYYTFTESAEITAYATAFTIIPAVMNNFVVIMLFMAFTIAMIMYTQTKQQGAAF